jgi:hypothetical protein
MASLLCCRPRRPESSPYSPDNLHELTHEGPANDRDIPIFVIDQYPPSSLDDAAALHTIFGSSSSVWGYRTANLSTRSSSQGTVKLRKRTSQKESEGRLEAVSSKIRKRFSKESRMNKKSCRTLSRKSKSQNLDTESNRTAIQLPDILVDTTPSQGGYDSDAENIETPNTMQEPVSGAIEINPEYLNRVLRKIRSSQHVPLLDEGSDANGIRLRRPSNPADQECIHGNERGINKPEHYTPRHTSARKNEQAAAIMPTSPMTPKNKPLDSNAAFWEFGCKESPTDLMRRISVAVSEHTSKYPCGMDRGRLPGVSRLERNDLRLSFTAPRRRSSARHGQDGSLDRFVRRYTALDQAMQAENDASDYEAQVDMTPTPTPKENSEVRGTLNATTQTKNFHAQFNPAAADTIIPTRKSYTQLGSAPEPKQDASDKSVHLFDMKISQRLGSGSFTTNHTPSRHGSKFVHSRGKSSIGSLDINPYHVRRRSKVSSIGIISANLDPDVPTPCRDDASSVYLSQPGSLPSSSKSSIRQIPNLLEELTKDIKDIRRKSIDRRDFSHKLLFVPSEGEWMRRNTIDPCRSSTDSFRVRELANVGARFPSQVRRATEPRGSKFTEIFESPIRVLPSPARSQTDLAHTRRGSGMSRSVSDGWLSGGRRHGFGFEAVPEVQAHVPPPLPEDDAAVLWERALKLHAEEAASSPSSMRSKRKGSRFGGSISRHREGRKSTRVVSVSITNERRPSADIGFSTNTLDDKNLCSSPAGQVFLSKKEKPIFNFSNRSFPSWTRFPSHTRKERIEHAGLDDGVITRDFSPPEGGIQRKTSSEVGFGGKREQKKTKSMTFGKRNLFSKAYWQRLYRSHSSDMRFQTGRKSSVSMCGELEYPELEIIPGGELAFAMNEVREPKREATGSAERMNGGGVGHAGNRSRSWNWEDQEEGGGKMGQSVRPAASMWSRLYDECIDVARSFKGGDGTVDTDEAIEEFHSASDGGGDSFDGGMERRDGEIEDRSGRVGKRGGERDGIGTTVPERAKTELRSEMSEVARGLLQDEESARKEALRRADEMVGGGVKAGNGERLSKP